MIFLVLGRRETGKTTLGYYVIESSPVRVIFDPRGLVPSSARIETRDDLTIAFDRIFESHMGELVITPRQNVQRLFDATMKELASYLTSPNAQHVGCLIDEFRFVDDTTGEDFNWILRCVPRTGANVVITAHRPIDVPTDIRAIADIWCLFAMTQEHDLKVIDARCGSRVRERVAKLPAHVFIKWDDGRAIDHEYADARQWYRALRASGARPVVDASLGELTPTPGLDRLF